MDISNKMLMDLAAQLGMEGKNTSQTKSTANMAEEYKNKNEDELLDEIMDLKKVMQKDKAQFEKQMKAIKSLRVMMNSEQKARLDKIIRLLEDE